MPTENAVKSSATRGMTGGGDGGPGGGGGLGGGEAAVQMLTLRETVSWCQGTITGPVGALNAASDGTRGRGLRDGASPILTREPTNPV